MKIISKYKDYYDYLIGIYGEDEKLILDRRNNTPSPILTSNSKLVFYIGGKVIEGYYHKDNNKFYYGNDLYQFEETPEKMGYHPSTHDVLDKTKKYVYIKDKDLAYRYGGSNFMVEICDDKDSINEKENCPIIMTVLPYKDTYNLYPKLSDYNLSSFISPNEMWLIISTYLSDQITKKEITGELSNDLKIQNKGFDLKRSFRPKMK